MKCNTIRAVDFRNIEDETVEFCDEVNILYGNNAEGKTNLLEAIYYMAIAKSFRGAKTAEILRFGTDRCELSLAFTDSLRRQTLDMTIHRGGQRSAEQNGCKVDGISSLVGIFRAVLFCPEHLSIVKEGPALRRNYLDVAICQLRPLYLRSLQRYNRTLKQRNILLKQADQDRKTFDSTILFWSYELAQEAAQIARTRLWYVKELNRCAGDCFSDMTSGREVPSFHYVGNAKLEEEAYSDRDVTEKKYHDLLLGSLEREIAVGSTLFGTHLDDIAIDLNGKPARTYASQGQQRSLALAMKIAEGEISRKETTEYPVFLFDDVLSELDAIRRTYLMHALSDRQVILTSCEPISGTQGLHTICVSGGRYRGANLGQIS